MGLQIFLLQILANLCMHLKNIKVRYYVKQMSEGFFDQLNFVICLIVARERIPVLIIFFRKIL